MAIWSWVRLMRFLQEEHTSTLPILLDLVSVLAFRGNSLPHPHLTIQRNMSGSNLTGWTPATITPGRIDFISCTSFYLCCSDICYPTTRFRFSSAPPFLSGTAQTHTGIAVLTWLQPIQSIA